MFLSNHNHCHLDGKIAAMIIKSYLFLCENRRLMEVVPIYRTLYSDPLQGIFYVFSLCRLPYIYTLICDSSGVAYYCLHSKLMLQPILRTKERYRRNKSFWNSRNAPATCAYYPLLVTWRIHLTFNYETVKRHLRTVNAVSIPRSPFILHNVATSPGSTELRM